jgi:hypothetical protein
MSQLSLFSADLTPPQLVDLGGLLAAHGQIVWDAGAAALVLVLADRWRAEALIRECRVRDVAVQISAFHAPDGPDAVPFQMAGDAARAGADPVVLRTDSTAELTALAADWMDEDGKAVPAGMPITPGFLRCWVIAAGRPTALGIVLGLDPLAPATHETLAAACAAAGLAGSLLGPRGDGPAVRIVGYRRCMRLVEMIGSPPPEAPAGAFPVGRH